MIVTRRGIRFEVEPDPFWEQRTWEDYTYRWLDALLACDTDFIDVGAWIGPFTLWAARLAGRVLAFEPDRTARDTLLRNIARTGARNVITSPRALGISPGAQRLYSGPRGWGRSTSTLVSPQSERESICVGVDRLDAVVQEYGFGLHRPLVVKIDTEASEGAILKGSLDWLLATRPSLVLALHDRLYGDEILHEVVPLLRRAYRHATDENGDRLRWPGRPDPRLMIFTDTDVD